MGMIEVKEIKYMEFRLKGNGGMEACVEENIKKAGRVMRQVWVMGKRMFGGEWESNVLRSGEFGLGRKGEDREDAGEIYKTADG